MFKRLVFLSVLFAILACRDSGQVDSIETLQKRVAKINETNRELELKRKELFGHIREFNSTRADSLQFDIASLDTMLGASERELLRAMFRNEGDISYNGLLKTIVAKNAEIGDLQDQIEQLRDQLPAPYTVQTGDTHYEVVLRYLMTEHGLSKDEAHKVAWRTSLVDEILPGNEIWLMYHDGVVGSFVTQGSAKLAPMTVQMLAKRQANQAAMPPEN